MQINDLNISIVNRLLFTGNFKADNGQITMIVGETGCGKTTFFKQLFLKKISNQQKEKYWYQNIAYMSQDVTQYDALTTKELEDCFKFNSTLTFEDFDITPIKNKKIAQYSQGEKQRISLLVTLWKSAKIMILDEPTSFLDRETQKKMMKHILDFTQKKHVTTIISSHHLFDRQFANRIYMIDNKQLLEIKTSNATAPIELSENNHNLACLKAYITKNIYHKEMIFQALILLAMSMLLIFSSFKIKDIEKNWLNTSNRYYLSYFDTEDTLPIYFNHQYIEIDGEYIDVGIMNYYKDMNFYTDTPLQDDDILVSEALSYLLEDNNITMFNHTYKVTNTSQLMHNQPLNVYRYMLFVPNDLYPEALKSNAQIHYYVTTFNSYKELSNFANKTHESVSYIGYDYSHPIFEFEAITRNIQAYRIMLISTPIIFALFAIGIQTLYRKKTQKELLWLYFNGLDVKVYQRFVLNHKIVLSILTLATLLITYYISAFPIISATPFLCFIVLDLLSSFYLKPKVH